MEPGPGAQSTRTCSGSARPISESCTSRSWLRWSRPRCWHPHSTWTKSAARSSRPDGTSRLRRRSRRVAVADRMAAARSDPRPFRPLQHPRGVRAQELQWFLTARGEAAAWACCARWMLSGTPGPSDGRDRRHRRRADRDQALLSTPASRESDDRIHVQLIQVEQHLAGFVASVRQFNGHLQRLSVTTAVTTTSSIRQAPHGELPRGVRRECRATARRLATASPVSRTSVVRRCSIAPCPARTRADSGQIPLPSGWPNANDAGGLARMVRSA